MKRAIINLAINEPYISYQKNLIQSIKSLMPDIPLITWTDELPPGSKSHSESMYGFKVWAFKYAFEQGYDSVIWIDSPVLLEKDISFLFDVLEADKNGEFSISDDPKLYMYSSEKTINYFKLTRQEIKDKKWDLNYGQIYGFTKDSETLKKLAFCESLGLFSTQAEHQYDHDNNSYKLFNGEYVSHRHDECLLSMIIQSEGRVMHNASIIHDSLTMNKYTL
jgi:hypothetical protein